MKSNTRYSDFADRIDVDVLYEELGFEVLETKGHEDQGHCILPWDLHKNGDTTGKLGINREKRVFNCFVCGGGNLLSLAMAVKDMDLAQATDWLYQFTSEDAISNESFIDDIEELLARTDLRVDTTLPYFNERVLDKWDRSHGWFAERGISEAVRAQYRLGYGESIRKVAPSRTQDPDYEGPAIVLPVFWKGRLVGWQNRWLEVDRPKWIAKYTNSGDFPRKEVLFNYDISKSAAQEVVIVESVPTSLYLQSLGVPSVATFGSAVTDQHLRLLRTFQKGIIISPDNDAPGRKCLDLLITGLERYIPIRVASFIEGEGSDLGDADPDTVKTALNGAETHI